MLKGVLECLTKSTSLVLEKVAFKAFELWSYERLKIFNMKL